MPAPEPGRRPPVGPAGEAHEGGDERRPDEEGVDQDGEREADPEQLDDRHLGGRDPREDDREEQRRRGHDPARLRQADPHRLLVVPVEVVLLLDAREQEDLVVHGEPERDAEHEDRREDVDAPGRREAEQIREVTLLEDPDHRAERRGQAEHVEQERLHRHEQAAGHQEEQQERGERDEAERPRQHREHGGLGVDERRRLARHAEPERRRGGPDVLDQPLTGGRVRLDVGHDRHPRPVLTVVRGEARTQVVRGRRRPRSSSAGSSRWPHRPGRRRAARRASSANASNASASRSRSAFGISTWSASDSRLVKFWRIWSVAARLRRGRAPRGRR